jgi:hypothetical protein
MHRFWCEIDAKRVAAAPIYVFPNASRFNGDDVEQLALGNMGGTLKLPHPHCIFEVQNPDDPEACLASYVRATAPGVDSFLFRFDQERRCWSDLLVAVEFRADGVAEVIGHPKMQDPKQYTPNFEAATSMVWRALGLLAISTPLAEQQLSPLRRRPFAKLGVRGWTYRIAEIDTAQVAAARTLQGGTHASPRWHVRRGHWRTLSDGQRVFVRECEVGDIARGGVIKDYRVTSGELT